MLTLRLAFRNILRQKRRSLLTGLSMTGGYMLFVFSFSLLEGSYGNAIDIFTLDNTGHIQIHKGDYLKRPKVHTTILARETVELTLATDEGVISFTPRVFSPALAYAANKSAPARVIGVDINLEPTVSRLRQKVSEGVYFDAEANEEGYFKVMVGRGLAHSLKLEVGSEVVLISQGADGSIANDIFIVSAIIGNKTSFDRMAAYLPLPVAQAFLSLSDDVHEYAILVENKYDNEEVSAALQEKLPGVTVSPWQVVAESFYRTMQSDKQGNYFSLGLIVFIVFVGVLNTVLMSVLERTREFGVLRAIGCRPLALVRLILLETVMLTLISVCIGVVLILPIIWWFTEVGLLLPGPIDMGGVEFDHMKGEISAFILLVPLGFILATAALISIPPGIRAARILPRDALGSH